MHDDDSFVRRVLAAWSLYLPRSQLSSSSPSPLYMMTCNVRATVRGYISTWNYEEDFRNRRRFLLFCSADRMMMGGWLAGCVTTRWLL